MNTDKFEELRSVLPSIAEVVKLFPDTLHGRVFDLLIDELLGGHNVASISSQSHAVSEPTEPLPQPITSKPARGKNKKRAETYSIDPHINLRGDGNNVPSFRDFYVQKQPSSAAEFNTVAVYYLKTLLAIDTITLDHVYTCYKEVGKKPPEAFRQSFYDTQYRTKYIEMSDQGTLTIPHRGKVFVEHDLPKPNNK